MEERERNLRKNNIVIKGIEAKKLGQIDYKWVEKFIERIMDVTIKVTRYRVSGNVIVATIENGKEKDKIMRRKGRLGEKKIFIENDLTWEERKIREKIWEWVKVERKKGRSVKIGYASVKIEGRWLR